jgi:hypothetical protein
VAREFAAEFYRALAKDEAIRVAFDQAAGLVRSGISDSPLQLIRPEYLVPAGAESLAGQPRERALVWGEELGETTEGGPAWPWVLLVRQDVPAIAGWKLSDLKEDPNHGLPPLPRMNFPEEPYPGFRRFTRRDALAFFGRRRLIRDLYEELTSPEMEDRIWRGKAMYTPPTSDASI